MHNHPWKLSRPSVSGLLLSSALSLQPSPSGSTGRTSGTPSSPHTMTPRPPDDPYSSCSAATTAPCGLKSTTSGSDDRSVRFHVGKAEHYHAILLCAGWVTLLSVIGFGVCCAFPWLPGLLSFGGAFAVALGVQRHASGRKRHHLDRLEAWYRVRESSYETSGKSEPLHLP